MSISSRKLQRQTKRALNPTRRDVSRNLGETNKALDTKIDAINSNYNSAASFSDPVKRGNFQTYPYDYFCGTNARVFFGDIWVDDIVTIQYSVRQDKEPIYGYASQNFDAIARGVVIVQGSFTIAFKEMGYLNVVQNTLEAQLSRSKQAGGRAVTNVFENKRALASSGLLAYDPRIDRVNYGGKIADLPTGSPEIIRNQETIEDILQYKKYGTNTVSEGLSTHFVGDSKPRDFEDFAELLEDSIWGDSNGNVLSDPVYKFRRADEFDYNWDGNEDMGGIKVAKGDNYAEVLNIMISFGDLNDYRAEHTMTVLNDVHIVSTSMVVSPTGEPIGETYMFIARDVNQTLTKETLNTISDFKYNVGIDSPDFRTPKMEDINAIETFLNKQNDGTSSIIIESLSKFAYIEDDIGSWEADSSLLASVVDNISFNPWDSKLDQVIRTVEKTVNDPAGTFNTGQLAGGDARTNYSQWLMKVTVIVGGGAGAIYDAVN